MAKKKTCFVIIGFGPKTDYATNRVLDLDKTFLNLIKPVFDELDIDCFRASEIRHSGIIDVPMYEWIYKADIVVADLSTLNPNALYELGVRHALRPFSTIVISENQMKYPFDINHTVIEPYEHLGKDIGVSEATRFKQELKLKVETILKNRKKDSPVYTYLNQLNPPTFKESEIKTIKEQVKNDPSFSEFVQDAEKAKDNNEFTIAAELYKICLKFDSNNPFLIQRLALVTYKSNRPNKKQALLDAEKILKQLNPDETTDAETLGLSGAINKRLFESTNDSFYLDKALWFYEKGFYIKQDYYNGINAAFLYTLRTLQTNNRDEAIANFFHGNELRKKVIDICLKYIKAKGFVQRTDRRWILQSLAQAYLGLNDKKHYDYYLGQLEKLDGTAFSDATFNEQNQQLLKLITDYKTKFIKH